jgi:hypothetical protein
MVQILSFPEYFASMYRHMMLIPENDDANNKVFFVIPPNQMDWRFKLTELNTNEWEVYAIREYDFGFESPWEYTVYYKRDTSVFTHGWMSVNKN